MNRFKKPQVLMLFLLAALLSIAPLLSSSLRPTYLYLVLNFLIISLGAEAGFFSVFIRPKEDNKKPVPTKEPSSLEPNEKKVKEVKVSNLECNEKKSEVVEKPNSQSEKVPATVNVVKKSPSMPSLFFIGGGEAEAGEFVEEYEEEDDEVGRRQELFAKAESFIGNFHKQLKMQREESWQRIHGLYQKAY